MQEPESIQPSRDDNTKQNVKAFALALLAMSIILLFSFKWGDLVKSFPDPARPPVSQAGPAVDLERPSNASGAISFNTSDKNVLTNGNFPVAADKLNEYTPEALSRMAQQIPVADITKKIYPTLGKAVKITGQVYKVEELPPDKELSGVWTEVLMLAKNPNSPMGSTTIDYLYKGDSSRINSGDIITCSGYLVGTYESPNALGGTVEAISFVGNYFTKQGK